MITKLFCFKLKLNSNAKGDGGDVLFDVGRGVPAFIFDPNLLYFYLAARLIRDLISLNKIELNFNDLQ